MNLSKLRHRVEFLYLICKFYTVSKINQLKMKIRHFLQTTELALGSVRLYAFPSAWKLNGSEEAIFDREKPMKSKSRC